MTSAASVWQFGWQAIAALATALAALATAYYAKQVREQVRQGQQQIVDGEQLIKAAEDDRRLTQQSLQMQQQRDERDTESRLSTQAALVSTFTEYSGSDHIQFIFTNHSPAYVTEVRWFFLSANGLARRDTGGRQPPGPDWSEIVPAADVNRAVPCGDISGHTFRDNAGVSWIKWGNGTLERVSGRRTSDQLMGRPSVDVLAAQQRD